MTDDNADKAAKTDFVFRYQGPSEVRAVDNGSEVSLVGNSERSEVRAQGRIKDPLRFREAMSVLYAVVGSDYRYVPKDRTAYLAYLRQQQQAPKKDMWTAQKAYFDWLQRNDPDAWLILDPIISVQPDGLFFEVFSKDESTYARLSVDWDMVEKQGDIQYGTTNIDFSSSFYDGIQKMRGYRDTQFSIAKDNVGLKTSDAGPEVLEKKVQVPDTWIRAFLQVQSAATLPRTSFKIAPIDFYNILRWLRFHKDQKRKGRGLRVELIPGEAPRLVLEPWEEVFTTSAGIYKGKSSKVVRIWGRRRLMLMRRLLPFLDNVEIHLLGSGLPSFYVFNAGPIKLTLGLSGWSAYNWGQLVSFDLMLPRSLEYTEELTKILNFLGDKRSASFKELSEVVGFEDSRLLAALQKGCQQGQLMYDLVGDVYRLRPLTDTPLDLDRLEFRNDRERLAHDLLAKDAVEIESENRLGQDTEIIGKVFIEKDQREYRPTLLLDPAGRVKKATCTSRFYRTHRLKRGPSTPLIALRLFYAQEEARRRELASRGELREITKIETRTYARRENGSEKICQLSLNHERLKMRWGQRGTKLRVQNLVFNSVDDARKEYFSKIDQLEGQGYLDATEGGVSD